MSASPRLGTHSHALGTYLISNAIHRIRDTTIAFIAYHNSIEADS